MNAHQRFDLYSERTCESCGKLGPDVNLLFGCSCPCGAVHWVHRLCAERLGVWAPSASAWGVTACPDAARTALTLMGEES